MTAEPIHEDLIVEIEEEKITPGMDLKVRTRALVEKYNWEDDHARKIWGFGPNGSGPNIFVDGSKGIQ